MLKQKQTVLGANGNCWSTCLACLLNMKTNDVPNFVALYKGDWYVKAQEWLAKRGFTLVHHDRRWAKTRLPKRLSIAVGYSPRYVTRGHAVIYKRTRPYWDVHEDETFLRGEVWDFYTLKRIDKK